MYDHGIARRGVDPGYGPSGDRKWLDKSALPGCHAWGQGVNHVPPDHSPLSQPAPVAVVTMESDRVSQVPTAGPAAGTLPAGFYRLDGDKRAGGQIEDAWTDGLHSSGELVAEHARQGSTGQWVGLIRGRERSFVVLVHVTSADAVERNGDQHLARAGNRLGQVVQPDVETPVVAQGALVRERPGIAASGDGSPRAI